MHILFVHFCLNALAGAKALVVQILTCASPSAGGYQREPVPCQK